MNIVALLVTDPQPPIAVQPRQRSLHSPAMAAQPLAALDAAPGDPGNDPSFSQRLTAERMVVALVGVQLLRPAARPARLPVVHGWDRVDGRLQQLAIVAVGPDSTAASGVPFPSTTRWCFVPCLPRSVGLGPTAAAPTAAPL
jgi:hypothetical protein